MLSFILVVPRIKVDLLRPSLNLPAIFKPIWPKKATAYVLSMTLLAYGDAWTCW